MLLRERRRLMLLRRGVLLFNLALLLDLLLLLLLLSGLVLLLRLLLPQRFFTLLLLLLNLGVVLGLAIARVARVGRAGELALLRSATRRVIRRRRAVMQFRGLALHGLRAFLLHRGGGNRRRHAGGRGHTLRRVCFRLAGRGDG